LAVCNLSTEIPFFASGKLAFDIILSRLVRQQEYPKRQPALKQRGVYNSQKNPMLTKAVKTVRDFPVNFFGI